MWEGDHKRSDGMALDDGLDFSGSRLLEKEYQAEKRMSTGAGAGEDVEGPMDSHDPLHLFSLHLPFKTQLKLYPVLGAFLRKSLFGMDTGIRPLLAVLLGNFLK